MPLLVTVVKSPESVRVAEASKTFSEQGGSLGRGKDNAWILDDPERFLSSCHCQISGENGQFYITDLSTNGTFFNGSVNPMGKGTKLALNDGNVFALGDYEFSVSVTQGAGSDPFASNASVDQVPDNDVFSSPASVDDFGLNDASPFGGGHVSSSDSLFSTNAEETDPLAALDKAQGGSSGSLHDFAKTPSLSSTNDPFQSPSGQSPSASDSFGQPTHSDQANPLNEQISWPNSVPEQGGGIPDDWDDDFLPDAPPPVPPPPVMAKPAPVSAFAKPQQVTAQSNAENTENVRAIVALRKEKEKIESELKILKQQVSAQKRSVQASIQSSTQASTHVDMALIEGMGLQDKNLLDEEIHQLNKIVGEVVREMISGLMQVLGSRSSIKNEFRMNVTTIQPVENNPLKFSANIDDALENMFIKQGNAYKKPVEAVREGFEGIAEHQVAILAGIRAAFRGVIERFDPLLLEQRFSKQKKSGIIPSSQKAKNWECYLEYYNDLASDIDNSFQYLFGDEFVKAYEDQLQKLLITRKSRNTKSE